MHFARLANTLLKTKKVHETITFLLVTLPNIHGVDWICLLDLAQRTATINAEIQEKYA